MATNDLIKSKASALDKCVHSIKHAIKIAHEASTVYQQIGEDLAKAVDQIYEAVDLENNEGEKKPLKEGG